MTCCGEREKFGDIKNEQKWTYIVRLDHEQETNPLTNSMTESRRFQVGLLRRALLIRLSVVSPLRQHWRLCRRHLRRIQLTFLRPLVRSSPTCHSLQHIPMDFCRLHHSFICSFGLPLDEGTEGDEEWLYHEVVPGSAGGSSTECAHGQGGSGLAPIPCVCGAHKGS